MAINSTTKTGAPVVLTGEEYLGLPVVRVQLQHPQYGNVSFTSSSYGEAAKGHFGILGHVRGQRACITVPREDYDAAMAEAAAIGEQELNDIRTGKVKIRVSYCDGEYLSGHSVNGRAGDLLISLGLAKAVEDWGILVDAKLVAALGEEFTYEQAAALAKPSKSSQEEAKREEKFAEARRTGKPVKLATWTEPCCEKDYDCSLDLVTEYARPDGTTTTNRVHTH